MVSQSTRNRTTPQQLQVARQLCQSCNQSLPDLKSHSSSMQFRTDISYWTGLFVMTPTTCLLTSPTL